jgi:hypothetical protein
MMRTREEHRGAVTYSRADGRLGCGARRGSDKPGTVCFLMSTTTTESGRGGASGGGGAGVEERRQANAQLGKASGSSRVLSTGPT